MFIKVTTANSTKILLINTHYIFSIAPSEYSKGSYITFRGADKVMAVEETFENIIHQLHYEPDNDPSTSS